MIILILTFVVVASYKSMSAFKMRDISSYNVNSNCVKDFIQTYLNKRYVTIICEDNTVFDKLPDTAISVNNPCKNCTFCNA